MAERLAKERIGRPPPGTVGVTGLVPAQIERQNTILDRLPWVEIASIAIVALAVAVRFRAVGAPLATLVAMGIAYVIASRSVAWIGERAGLSVPQEVQPVLVVLVFGVATDYSIFFLSRFRAIAADGASHRGRAARVRQGAQADPRRALRLHRREGGRGGRRGADGAGHEQGPRAAGRAPAPLRLVARAARAPADRRDPGFRARRQAAIPPHRDGPALYAEHWRECLRRPIRRAETSWILEANGPMIRAMRALGGDVVKRYRIYERPLASASATD